MGILKNAELQCCFKIFLKNSYIEYSSRTGPIPMFLCSNHSEFKFCSKADPTTKLHRVTQ